MQSINGTMMMDHLVNVNGKGEAQSVFSELVARRAFGQRHAILYKPYSTLCPWEQDEGNSAIAP